MNLELLYLMIVFVVFALIVIFLGVISGKKKDVIKEVEEKNLKNQDSSKKGKDKKKYFTNKIIVSADVTKMQYHGSTPFIQIDENWQQMPLDRTVLTIPREVLTRMFPLAYLAGKLSVMEQATKVGIVMILLFILVIGNLVLTYYKTDTNSAQIKDVSNSLNNSAGGINEIRTTVSNQNNLLNVIAEKLNITGNYSTPTVGG
jgi:preprotein translocase subunit SecG